MRLKQHEKCLALPLTYDVLRKCLKNIRLPLSPWEPGFHSSL